MSVRASSWAWECSQARGSAFLVLLCLADHAGQDGGDAWPSVERLAHRCRVDERTVQRALATLRDLGEIVVQDEATSRRPTRYRLVMRGDNLSPQAEVGGDILSSRGGNPSVEGRQDATRTKREPLGTAPPATASPLASLVKDRSCELCEGAHVVPAESGDGYVQCPRCVRAA